MPDLPAPAADLAERLVCADLAAAARLHANHLATAIAHARSRGEPVEALETRMSVLLSYEFRLARRGGSKSEARYEPKAMGDGA